MRWSGIQWAQKYHTVITQVTTKRTVAQSLSMCLLYNDDFFSTVFNVSAETYAKYAVGDVVEVEVQRNGK